MSKIQTIILHLKLWRWAAMHSPMDRVYGSTPIPAFSKMSITLLPLFYLNFENPGGQLVIKLSINLNPGISYWIPGSIVSRFAEAHGLEESEIDGIPF